MRAVGRSSALIRAIGILGGTFAPVHNGHLRIAIEVRERLRLDEVRLIPAAQPPHRAAPAVPAARRLEWVRLAVAGAEALLADERELKRGGPSYTVDSLRELRAENRDASLCLILGVDALEALHTWHQARGIPRLANVVVLNRNGAAPGFETSLAQHWPGAEVVGADALRRRAHGGWHLARAPVLEISSSRIRQLLKAGRSVRGLVPDAVLQSFTQPDLEDLTRNEIAAVD